MVWRLRYLRECLREIYAVSVVVIRIALAVRPFPKPPKLRHRSGSAAEQALKVRF